MEEKRKFFRIKKPFLMKFQDSCGKQYCVSVSDISEQGVCFLSPVVLDSGSKVDLLLKLPSNPNQWQDCHGQVLESKDLSKDGNAFLNGFRTRIKFINIPEDISRVLREHCALGLNKERSLGHILEQKLGMLDKDREKRKNVRINKPLVGMYAELNGSTPGEWDVTTVRNLSLGGAIFTTKVFYKSASVLRLMLKIPSRPIDFLEFDARVVESKQLRNLEAFSIAGAYLTRVRFTPVSPEKIEILREYIEWFISHLKKQIDSGLE
ncbi:MAG: PilZ domain protein [Candidatus Omnitrophica bacterium ADurb.Bin205]|nr:MAG: PilZ domain protein [Candidatus Omnitrophica bacterium ADurb.Bin205]